MEDVSIDNLDYYYPVMKKKKKEEDRVMEDAVEMEDSVAK